MTENEAIKEIKCWLNFCFGYRIAPELVQATRMATEALKEVQQYRAIGTVEECREAIEKQKSKKPTEQFRLGTSGRGGKCPSCKHYLDRSVDAMYCDCGQKLDWSDEE